MEIHAVSTEEELYIAGVKENGLTVIHVPPAQLTEKVALAAVENNPRAYAYLDDTQKQNVKVAKLALGKDGSLLGAAPDEMRDSYEVAIEAAKQSWDSVEYASDRLKRDRKFGVAACSAFGHALIYLNGVLQNDFEVVSAAVIQNVKCIEYASQIMQENKEVMKLVTPNPFKRAFAEVKKEDINQGQKDQGQSGEDVRHTTPRRESQHMKELDMKRQLQFNDDSSEKR